MQINFSRKVGFTHHSRTYSSRLFIFLFISILRIFKICLKCSDKLVTFGGLTQEEMTFIPISLCVCRKMFIQSHVIKVIFTLRFSSRSRLLTLFQLWCIMVDYISNMSECLLIFQTQKVFQLAYIFLDNNKRLSKFIFIR